MCCNCCLIVGCCLIVNRFATLTVTKNYCYASDICGRREEAQIMKGLGWMHHGEVQSSVENLNLGVFFDACIHSQPTSYDTGCPINRESGGGGGGGAGMHRGGSILPDNPRSWGTFGTGLISISEGQSLSYGINQVVPLAHLKSMQCTAGCWPGSPTIDKRLSMAQHTDSAEYMYTHDSQQVYARARMKISHSQQWRRRTAL